MTHAIDSNVLGELGVRPRVDLPQVPHWVVPRARLSERLDLGARGRLTLVVAPTGWGKTLGVSSWASSTATPGGLLWISLAGSDGDPDLFWRLFHESLLATGERHLAGATPTEGASESLHSRALARFGGELRRSGPWVVVLDDYPSGAAGTLGQDLETVMEHAHRGLSVVVVSQGEPALSVQRHHVAGELTRIGVPDLAMDTREVAAVLARDGHPATDLTARMVQRHTTGWACGVRLVAGALHDAPTVESALEEADRRTVDYLSAEVLAKTPEHVHELIVRTSMVEQVSRDLAATFLESEDEAVLDRGSACAAFVDLDDDGSFRCHPLLRAAAQAELERRPSVAREARRRVAGWHLDRGETSIALEISLAGADWGWAAHMLVESYAVPGILAGSTSGIMRSALEVAAVCAEEPLLEAALLLGRGGPDAAEAVLEVLAERDPGTRTMAHELSSIFVRLAVCRARGDAETGLPLATRARELMAHLGVERQRELFTVLEADVGALELGSGELVRAEVTLRHGAVGGPGRDATSNSRLDCLGQLALLEAFRGNLRQAERQAALVMKGAPPVACRGMSHAHLAMAWVHLERGDHVPARQHLDRAVGVGADDAEPWYATAQLLVEAGLLVATDQPEAAVRVLTPAIQAGERRAGERRGRGSAWTRSLLMTAVAKALVASGEPKQALVLVSQEPGGTGTDLSVVVAQARVDLGDLQGARAALDSAAGGLSGARLAVQLECWLLEARLAEQAEKHERASRLVDRALREAGRELMRRPVAAEAEWLLPLVEGHPALRRTHGGFLTGLKSATYASSTWRPGPGRATELIETLTVREAQVLGLLADMCSTEEIAHELFLSVNTVKTYVRGILRKLTVNRRVDAVRRGRELGLC
jgi:LuxR family maltose regulon positive regulatory protein